MINIRFSNQFQNPESIPVQNKNLFLMELESESSISENDENLDSGIDFSPGIITPLITIFYILQYYV